MVAITKFTREDIFNAVRLMYTSVAREPEAGFHFPTGRESCEFLGYPAPELDALPPEALASFAGVGYPFRCDVIRAGDAVLDIGSGSGTDTLIAALRCGPAGRVYGLDLTDAMHEKLKENADRAGMENIEALPGNAEEIPLPDETVDVVTSNGVLNLVPDKPRAFREIHRVMKPGGRLQLSDIVINHNVTELENAKNNPQLWAECIVGALFRDHYVAGLAEAGLDDITVHCRQDYFSRSSNESTRNVAAHFQAESITLSAVKP